MKYNPRKIDPPKKRILVRGKKKMAYDPQRIERKWQRIWEKRGIFKAKDFSKKSKFYILDMYPYPSAEGLHVGHPRGYVASDIIANYKRMKGYNVLHPMGWDAFGLPAENYALRTGIHPEISTKKNIKKMREQIKSIGLSYDWTREINTTDYNYYKWTQWLFLLFYKRGLAHEAVLPINWCPSCKTGLANEEVVEGRCERCGTEVTKRKLRQWVLKITAYAERLLEDLDKLDWPEKIKEMQKNWIGRSEGTIVRFQVAGSRFWVEVFTTRIDTLFGATYLVLAPEHPLISNLKSQVLNLKEVEKYIESSQKKSERERISEIREKTGIELKGIKAINPANNEKIPIFVADYVLPHYSTGAIMAVPAHDKRDFEFAKKYNLPVKTVICPNWPKPICPIEIYEGEGRLVDSGKFTGMSSQETRQKITEWLSEKKLAKRTVNYKLRDWIFSRQRYWGEPIPIVHCRKCGTVPLREKDLPLKLPKIKKYQPTGTGESPLAIVKDWVETRCPKCGGPAKRETNTMPQWAGSCWYFLKYVDSENKRRIFEKKKVKYWLPVDLYIGGSEHAVLHLLYSRFWIKVLYDEGLIEFDEPFLKLRNQGLILAPDGQKMSKSKGNVISPDEIIKEYGADTLRLYEMFMGPFEQSVSWDIKGIVGMRRFLERVWKLRERIERQATSDKKQQQELEKLIHKTIKKVTEDIENLKFNTAISQLMILVNGMEKQDNLQLTTYKLLLKLLAPFSPHICEEIWHQLVSNKKQTVTSIFKEKWPEYEPQLIKEKRITLIVQVNGKVRDKIEVEADISEEKAKEIALSREKIEKWIEGKEIKKIIFIQGKLMNIVI